MDTALKYTVDVYAVVVIDIQVVCVHISWLATVGLVRRVVMYIQPVMLAQLLVQLVYLSKIRHDSRLIQTRVFLC